MQDKKQEEITLTQLIISAMAKKGWKPVTLSKESGVNEATISRALKKGRGLSSENLFSILKALNLIGVSSDPAGISYENKELHDSIEDILNSGNHELLTALQITVEGIRSVMKQDKTNELLEKILEKVESLPPPASPHERKSVTHGARAKRSHA